MCILVVSYVYTSRAYFIQREQEKGRKANIVLSSGLLRLGLEDGIAFGIDCFSMILYDMLWSSFE